MRVALKIVALLMAVLLVVWGTLEAGRVVRETQIVEAELQRDHRILGTALVAAIQARPLEERSPAVLEELLERVELAEREIHLELRPGAIDDLRQQVLPGGVVTSLPLHLREGEYQLVLREPLDEIDRVTQQGRRSLLLGSGLLLVLGLLASAVGGQIFIGQRLERLVGRAAQIGRGELAPALAARGRDEIGAMAQALEDLAVQLDTSRQHAAREQEARLEAVLQLRHADRLRLVGDLAAGVAHEVGSPLHVVGGTARLLQDDPDATDEIRESAALIRNQVARMSTLIQRLLELAHPDPPAQGAELVAPMWSELSATAGGLVRDTGVVLEVGEAPPGCIPMRSAWFAQIFANLVRNAVQAQPGGGRVRVTGTVAGDQLVIDVDDAGPGISDEVRERIFSPFFTTKEPGEGLGLGLSLVEGLIEECGGTVQAGDSELGGARFSVTLPWSAVEVR